MQNLNTQWQKYDSSREDYYRGRKETPGLGGVSTALLHQEISRLNGLLEERMNENQRLESARRQDQDRMQTLEQQVGLGRVVRPSLGC